MRVQENVCEPGEHPCSGKEATKGNADKSAAYQYGTTYHTAAPSRLSAAEGEAQPRRETPRSSLTEKDASPLSTSTRQPTTA